MNKTIKHMIAITLTISAFSSVQPVSHFNLMTTKAYAASSYVSNVTLNKSAGSSTIKLYKDEDYDTSTEFKASIDEYYAKTYTKSVNVTFDDDDSKYVTYVFKESSKTATPFDSGEEIDLDKGDNTLYVRTYKSSRFDKNNVKNDITEEYEIHINRKASSEDSDVYLSKISLDYGKLSFSKTNTDYDVDVNSSVDELEITAKPEDDSYTVRIDGNEVDDDDDYADVVDLKKGKNEIEIEVTDEDDNDNIYTLNVYRGGRDTSSSSESSSSNLYLNDITLNDGNIEFAFNKKTYSYDVNVDTSVDKLKLKAEPEDEDDTVEINDGSVNSNYERTVSLENGKKNTITIGITDEDGNDRTYTLNVTRGIISSDSDSTSSSDNTDTSTNTNTSTSSGTNNTSTSDDSQIKKSTWFKDSSGKWMYYDENGNTLKSQWHYDLTVGKWYYLRDDGYMQTGWLFDDNKWYALDGNGAMINGWFNDHGQWYYLNSDGSMRTGWLVSDNKKYYLNVSGIMETGTKTIDGSSYTFDESGACQE